MNEIIKERIRNIERQVKNQQETLNSIAEICCISIRKFSEAFGFVEDVDDNLKMIECKLNEKTAPENSSAER